MFEQFTGLRYHTTSPVRAAFMKFVRSPEAFFRQEGSTTFLCGFGEAHLVLDYAEEIVGGVEIQLRTLDHAHVTVVYEESMEDALRRDPNFCPWFDTLIDTYDIDAGVHTLRSQGRRGFRYIGIYVSSPASVELLSANAINGGWPVQQLGSFRCSDERLNKIWDISANTVRACMQNYFEDGVKRDGLLWLGDSRLTIPSAWYIFGDGALARKSLLIMKNAQYPNGAITACAARGGGHIHDIPSGIAYMPTVPEMLDGMLLLNYICEFILAIDTYIRLTGDRTILPEILDTAKKAMEFLVTTTDLETPGIWWIDQYKNKPDANGLTYDIQYECTMNPRTNFGSKGGFLLEMMDAARSLGRLAARAGDEELHTWSEALADRLDDHIETHYKETQYGRYLDEKGQSLFQTLQYTAILATLAGKEDPNGIYHMTRSVMPCWGYVMTLRIAALFQAGCTADALRDIRSAWGQMLDAGDLTCWERLDLPINDATHYFDAKGSRCHGWTAGPAWLLPEWITGVHAEADGFDAVRIQPDLADLDWAEATVPTPHGLLQIRVERYGRSQKLYLDLPEGITSCTIQWPESAPIQLNRAGCHVLSFGIQ